MFDVSHLFIDVRPGDRLAIVGDSRVDVELVHKSGQLARLRITAPRNVRIVKSPGVEESVPSMAT